MSLWGNGISVHVYQTYFQTQVEINECLQVEVNETLISKYR